MSSIISNQNFEVKPVEENNRGLFAKREFRPWETVLQSKPMASCVAGFLKDKVCTYCMIESQVSRCSKCKVTHYCSKQCQREDWKVHKEQCSIYKNMVQGKKIPLAKLSAQFGINLRVWLLRQKVSQINEKFSKMCCLLEFFPHQKIQQMQELAVVLMENLSLERNEQNMTNLMKQISTISINGFTVQDYLCQIQSIGVALYFPNNFLNHSCQPNCVQIYDGNIQKIVARRAIKTGEQLTISYLMQNKDLTYRRETLRSGYLFQCFCQVCQIDKMFDWEVFYILCPQCHKKGLIKGKQKNKINKLESEFMKDQEEEDEGVEKGMEEGGESERSIPRARENQVYCQQCNTQLTFQQLKQIKGKAKKLSQTICSSGISYEVSKKAYFDLKKILHESDPNFGALLNNIYLLCLEKAFQEPKYYSQAYILLKDLLQKMPMRFRLSLEEEEIPYTYVWKYAEMGKLAYNLGKKKKAWQYTEKAGEIINKINFSHNFVEVKELKERYQQLKVSLSFEKAEIFKK